MIKVLPVLRTIGYETLTFTMGGVLFAVRCLPFANDGRTYQSRNTLRLCELAAANVGYADAIGKSRDAHLADDGFVTSECTA